MIECVNPTGYCTDKCPQWRACIAENLEARKTYDEEGMARMINGILRWAVKDWAGAHGSESQRRAETFFQSHYFGSLTGLDGEIFLETLRKRKAENETKARKRWY